MTVLKVIRVAHTGQALELSFLSASVTSYIKKRTFSACLLVQNIMIIDTAGTLVSSRAIFAVILSSIARGAVS